MLEAQFEPFNLQHLTSNSPQGDLTAKRSIMLYVFNIFAAQRHLHPADVENRPNGLTINIFNGQYSPREDC